jgi:nucleoside-diphosphate-sugar epimerase
LFPHIGYPIGSKLFFIIGRGVNLLPPTYGENTVDAILLAAIREEVQGQAYHIIDGFKITQREYLQKFISATRTKFFKVSIPFSLLVLLTALVEPLRDLPMLKTASLPSKFGLLSKWKSLTFDTSKAKSELNWSPRIGLEDALNKTFDWYNTRIRGDRLLGILAV